MRNVLLINLIIFLCVFFVHHILQIKWKIFYKKLVISTTKLSQKQDLELLKKHILLEKTYKIINAKICKKCIIYNKLPCSCGLHELKNYIEKNPTYK